MAEIENRLKALEGYNPAVTNERLQNLAKDVQALKRSFYTFCLGVVGSSILFALTVFALLGRHP